MDLHVRNISSDRVPSAAIVIPVYRSILSKVHLTTIKASVRHFLVGNDLWPKLFWPRSTIPIWNDWFFPFLFGSVTLKRPSACMQMNTHLIVQHERQSCNLTAETEAFCCKLFHIIVQHIGRADGGVVPLFLHTSCQVETTMQKKKRFWIKKRKHLLLFGSRLHPLFKWFAARLPSHKLKWFKAQGRVGALDSVRKSFQCQNKDRRLLFEARHKCTFSSSPKHEHSDHLLPFIFLLKKLDLGLIWSDCCLISSKSSQNNDLVKGHPRARTPLEQPPRYPWQETPPS